MVLIKSEYTNIDFNNKIVELTYYVENEEKVRLIFDIKNDRTDVKGNLYSLIGYKNNPLDKDKYIKYIQIQKWMAEKILENYSTNNGLGD